MRRNRKRRRKRYPENEMLERVVQEAGLKLKSPVISAISSEHQGFEGMKKSFWRAVRFFETASEAGANAFTSSRHKEACGEQVSMPGAERFGSDYDGPMPEGRMGFPFGRKRKKDDDKEPDGQE